MNRRTSGRPRRPSPLLLLPLFALLLGGCPDKDPLVPPDAGPDLSQVDRGPADRGTPDRSSPDTLAHPDAAPPVPFTPAPLPLGELACLARGISTAGGSAGQAARAADLSPMAAAGIKRLRADFHWHVIEPKKGSFDFSRYDRRMTQALAAGIEHIVLLAYGNPWASSKTEDDKFYPPDDPADFGRYAAATVAHYRGQATLYEVWNEPNGGYRFWKTNPLGDPPAYAALLKAAYTAAKKADPTAQIIFGGPFFHDQVIPGHLTFLRQAYDAEPKLGDYFDAMAIHPYALYPPAAPPEKDDDWETGVGRMVAQVRALMAKHGDGDKPIYVTEVGWPVWSSVSEAQQARYLVRAYLLLAAAGVRSYCWYTLRDQKSNAVSTEATFGLFDYSADPTKARAKPSWTAYRTLLQTLGAYRLSADLRAPLALAQDTFAYRLTHPTSTARATVLWSRAPGGQPLTLTLAPSTKTVEKVTIEGKKTTLTPQSGKVTLTAGEDPIYLLEK